MKIEKANLIPIVLSMIVAVFIFWVEATPEDSNNYFRLKTNQTMHMMNYLRYEVKLKLWVQKNELNKTSKVIIINVYDPYYSHKASKNAHEYLMISRVIKKLRAIKTKAIATDIVISQSHEELIKDIKKFLHTNIQNHPKAIKISKLDDDFVDLVKNSDNLVLPFIFTAKKIQEGTLPQALLAVKNTSPIPMQFGYITNFQKVQKVSKHNGFINTLLDEDSIIRKAPLLLRYKNKIYPSLALSIAMNVKDIKSINLNTVNIVNRIYLESISFGKQNIKVDKSGAIFIPFNRDLSNITSYSATDILNNNLKQADLENAIILIASNKYISPKDAKDYLFAPITNIEAQASILSAIIANKIIYEPFWARYLTLSLIICLSLVLIVCFRFFGSVISTLIAISLQVCLIATSLFCFFIFGITFNVAGPLLLGLLIAIVNLIFGFIFESNRKKQLKNFFAQYVPPDYLNILLDNPQMYGFDGKSENLTVLFADIRNFTGISESLGANSVKKLLNEFFTPMTVIILRHGGTIDKYIGDMIMAFFGAPVANPNQCESALNCALEMLATTKKMQKHFQAKNLPKVELSVGLSSGMMNVGDMGSKFRRSYTVIGNAVNLGARIQSATAFYGVDLIASYNTCKQQDKFVFRLLDKVKLKGKQECETIYEVVGRKENISASKIAEIQEHHQAIAAYFARNWDLAIQMFANLMQKHPNYKPYNIFYQRAQHYRQNPPPQNWDGAYTFTAK